jgi:UPF0042 nucleotide-binding protein
MAMAMAEGNAHKRGKRMRDRVSDVVVITGMSGSGRTQALHVFEDMGYYCIDNLPPSLILQLVRIVGINSSTGRHLGVTCDLRSQGLFDEFADALRELAEHEVSAQVLFLDCSDDVLVRRYDENRRRHPLQVPGEPIDAAIRREREQLADARLLADHVIDTSRSSTATLRRRIRQYFSPLSERELMDVNVFSFGFKHGMPEEADILIDVRFLPNPFYDPVMRNLDGNDERVASFVLDHPKTKEFFSAWTHMLEVVLPGYAAEGKPTLSIAVGCTGGQHRSVAIANATAAFLRERNYRVTLSHRDLALAVPRMGEFDAH